VNAHATSDGRAILMAILLDLSIFFAETIRGLLYYTLFDANKFL